MDFQIKEIYFNNVYRLFADNGKHKTKSDGATADIYSELSHTLKRPRFLLRYPCDTGGEFSPMQQRLRGWRMSPGSKAQTIFAWHDFLSTILPSQLYSKMANILANIDDREAVIVESVDLGEQAQCQK